MSKVIFLTEKTNCEVCEKPTTAMAEVQGHLACPECFNFIVEQKEDEPILEENMTLAEQCKFSTWWKAKTRS